MTATEVAYDLYHALISAGHAPWCPALNSEGDRCRCGRTDALAAYRTERVGERTSVLSLVSERQG